MGHDIEVCAQGCQFEFARLVCRIMHCVGCIDRYGEAANSCLFKWTLEKGQNQHVVVVVVVLVAVVVVAAVVVVVVACCCCGCCCCCCCLLLLLLLLLLL